MAFADNFEAWFDGLMLDAIGPTVTLAQTTEKISASSLKMRWHFDYKVDAGAIDALKKFKETIKTSLGFMENDEQQKYEAISMEMARCQTTIYEHSARLVSSDKRYSNRIKNEAALRYVLGDPIMEMMCVAGNLKVYTLALVAILRLASDFYYLFSQTLFLHCGH